jgi:hypothetical protein
MAVGMSAKQARQAIDALYAWHAKCDREGESASNGKKQLLESAADSQIYLTIALNKHRTKEHKKPVNM